MTNNTNNINHQKSVILIKRPSPDYSNLFLQHGYNSIFITPYTPRQTNYDKLYNLLKTMPVNLTTNSTGTNNNHNYYWAVVVTSQNAAMYFKQTYENVKAELNSSIIS